MRKRSKIVLIDKAKDRGRGGHQGSSVPVTEEIRLLTCRQTSDSISFHLGAPLLHRHHADNNGSGAPGKLLPFPSAKIKSAQE